MASTQSNGGGANFDATSMVRSSFSSGDGGRLAGARSCVGRVARGSTREVWSDLVVVGEAPQYWSSVVSPARRLCGGGTVVE